VTEGGDSLSACAGQAKGPTISTTIVVFAAGGVCYAQPTSVLCHIEWKVPAYTVALVPRDTTNRTLAGVDVGTTVTLRVISNWVIQSHGM
jgi:hypothetical protein